MKFYNECLESGRYLLAEKLEYAMNKDAFTTTTDWVNGIRIWLYQTSVYVGSMSLDELGAVVEQLTTFYGY